LHIAWFEEPCIWHDDAAQMARVRAQTSIPINAGQSEITLAGVRRLLDANAVDLVNYDVSECGGVTDWRRAAALCQASAVEMAHHEESQIAQHLIAAVPHGTYIECFADPARDPVWQTMWANRPKPIGGRMPVTEGPGFGLALDGKMIEKYRVA
jgi:D-galactarolactone cycloisomerase